MPQAGCPSLHDRPQPLPSCAHPSLPSSRPARPKSPNPSSTPCSRQPHLLVQKLLAQLLDGGGALAEEPQGLDERLRERHTPGMLA